jgi:hypothetical protein
MESISLLRAMPYLDHAKSRQRKVRLILLSLSHVAFVELCDDGDWRSKTFVFIMEYSKHRCSPGFRALSRVLTSNYQASWEMPTARRESRKISLLFEVLEMILNESEPRDAVSFAKALFDV